MNQFTKGMVSGLFFSIAIVAGCAATFPYRYYAMSLPKNCYDQGKLLGKLGKDGWPDAPMSECKPDPNGNKLKCVTMYDPEFYALKDDDEACHSRLDDTQRKLDQCLSGNHVSGRVTVSPVPLVTYN